MSSVNEPGHGSDADDPHADREARRYKRPIASREHILQTLRRADRALSEQRLAQALDLDAADERRALGRRLAAMVRDGQLIADGRRRYSPPRNETLVAGRVSGHRDGYGFLVPDDGGDDLYLSSRQMRAVLHGDRALARVSGADRHGRRKADIVEVLERVNQTLVGRYYRDGAAGVAEPLNRAIAQEFHIADGDSMGARHRQLVVAEITRQPDGEHRPAARVVQILGEQLEAGVAVRAAIHNGRLPHVFADEALHEADQFATEVTADARAGRVDLTALPLVTIDGEDARDFDDAVYCQANGRDGFRLFVAIADVAEYVRPGTPLDHDAGERATSVYFPRYVVPMLPEKLSNGLCSLNADVDRLAMVCELTVSAPGRIGSYRFYEAVIRSHARLTYAQAGDYLATGHMEPDLPADVLDNLRRLDALHEVLRQARNERGALDIDSVETRFVFDAGQRVEAIVPVQRNRAHTLIEECMLAANVCAARFLRRHELAGLYRVHERPDSERVESLRVFLGELGLVLGGDELPTPADYQQLIEKVRGQPHGRIIQTMLLRSMQQAVYRTGNAGHFGLNYREYAHFTSPIRRYPDLLVHRAIKSVIHSTLQTDQVRRSDTSVADAQAWYPYSHAQLVALGEHCSMAERRADEAGREVAEWLTCQFMEQYEGSDFDAVISTVTGFGLFVEMSGVFAEGLVHISTLGDDYFHFEPALQMLVGEHSGLVYRIGDSVRVQVARVDVDDRKIDCELLSHTPTTRRRRVSDNRRVRHAGRRGHGDAVGRRGRGGKRRAPKGGRRR